MFIDSSRIEDLRLLKDIIDDPNPGGHHHIYARRAYGEVLKQLKDRTLANMRERLVKAVDAKDRYEIWKIRNQIKDYLGEERFDERNY